MSLLLAIDPRPTLGHDDLLAYELLERLRERWLAGGVLPPGRAPFWPEAAFAAADVHVHAARELRGRHPPLALRWRAPAPAEVEGAARELFGTLPFDPVRYCQELAAQARAGGWSSP